MCGCSEGAGSVQVGAGKQDAGVRLIANVIWSPVAFAQDFGLEYMDEHRVVINNLKGDENP